MVKFNVPPEMKYDMAHHFEIATRIADEISATFIAPIELEFEKTYFPFLLYAKKKYAGAMYTTPSKLDYVDIKGMSIVRRDFAVVSKGLSQKVLDAVMVDKSADRALDVARAEIVRILRGEVPVEDFVLSKTLRTGYKNENQPHVAVAKKMRERTGAAVHSGQRVPYVFVKNDANPNGLQVDRAEDPVWVAEHGLNIDYLYYIDHQMKAPIVDLLEVVVDAPGDAIFGHESVKGLLDEYRSNHTRLVKTAKRLRVNAERKQYEITKFMKTTSSS